jgi:hypothetical protein
VAIRHTVATSLQRVPSVGSQTAPVMRQPSGTCAWRSALQSSPQADATHEGGWKTGPQWSLLQSNATGAGGGSSCPVFGSQVVNVTLQLVGLCVHWNELMMCPDGTCVRASSLQKCAQSVAAQRWVKIGRHSPVSALRWNDSFGSTPHAAITHPTSAHCHRAPRMSPSCGDSIPVPRTPVPTTPRRCERDHTRALPLGGPTPPLPRCRKQTQHNRLARYP